MSLSFHSSHTNPQTHRIIYNYYWYSVAPYVYVYTYIIKYNIFVLALCVSTYIYSNSQWSLMVFRFSRFLSAHFVYIRLTMLYLTWDIFIRITTTFTRWNENEYSIQPKIITLNSKVQFTIYCLCLIVSWWWTVVGWEGGLIDSTIVCITCNTHVCFIFIRVNRTQEK